jgi:hypothetical protein
MVSTHVMFLREPTPHRFWAVIEMNVARIGRGHTDGTITVEPVNTKPIVLKLSFTPDN